MSTAYRDWRGIAQALKTAATQRAQAAGDDVNHLLRQAEFDRLLSRVFIEGPDVG